MTKLLTLETVLRVAPTTKPGDNIPEAQASGAASVDDFGRKNELLPRPMVGTIFQPRVRDRFHAVMPPWSPEQIVQAYLNAERGDMNAQSDLMEHMEDRDGALAGFMQTRRLAPCGLKWSIEAANDTTQAEAIAEMVRAEIEAIPKFRIAFRKMMDAVGKGVAVLWIDWQPGGRTPDTKFRIEGLNHINPKRYRFHWQREELLIVPDLTPLGDGFQIQPGSGLGVSLPDWKAIIHQTQIKTGHPAKAGVLRTVGFDFLARNYAIKDFMVYCDIFGMPVRLGRYPDGASDEDKAALAAAIENLGTDSAAIVSKLTDIQFLETTSRGAGSGGGPFEALDALCERRMQLAILGQDQTNTHNAAGGRTQVAEGGAKVRQDLLEADCIDVEETLTSQLCKPIVGFSRFGWTAAGALCPRFKLHYEPEADYESNIAVDVPLYSVLGLPVTVGDLAKRYGRELPKGVDPNSIVKPLPAQQAEQATKLAQQQAQQGNNKPPSFARSFTEQLTTAVILGQEDRNDRGYAGMIANLAPDLQRLLLASPHTSEKDRAAIALAHPQAAVDVLADAAVTSGEDAITSLVAPVAKLVDEATSMTDLQNKLRAAFDDLDAAELETLIKRTTFIARLYGRFTAKKG